MDTYFICHICPILNMTTVKTYRKLEPQSWFGGGWVFTKKKSGKQLDLGAFLSFFPLFISIFFFFLS